MILSQLNNRLMFFLCHLLEFCRTALWMRDVGNHNIRILKHKFVAVIDSKSWWHGFNAIGQNGMCKVIGMNWRLWSRWWRSRRIYWEDKKFGTGIQYLIKKQTTFVETISRNGYAGIGKPKPLKNDLSGYWSRRIDEVNRLVYRITDDVIEVLQCRGHYSWI